MLKIQVPMIAVEEKAMGSGKDSWQLREQTGVLLVPGKLTGLEIRFRLQPTQEPVAVGEYEVDPSSYSAGKFGRVDFAPKPGKRIEAAGAATPIRKSA
jgi:hypothetical protein